jgi:hypothetical protein
MTRIYDKVSDTLGVVVDTTYRDSDMYFVVKLDSGEIVKRKFTEVKYHEEEEANV